MGAFLFAAMSLVAVTMLLLLRPWQSRNTEHASAARELNIRIYRDQLAELDRDLAAGALAPADHAHSRDELQRRLLDDSALVQAPPAQLQRTRHTTLILALAMPLAASGIYAALGTPEALLARAATASAGAQQVTADEIDQMVAGLAARLEKNPADAKGWAMLARSYRALGRHAEAQAAFERLSESLNHDPQLLAEIGAPVAPAAAAAAVATAPGDDAKSLSGTVRLSPDLAARATPRSR